MSHQPYTADAPCPCGSETLRLDRIERKAAGLRAADLDEILFADAHIVDCRYTLGAEGLAITALTGGSPAEETILRRVRSLAPALKVSFSYRLADTNDRAMYAGKRVLMRNHAAPI